MLSSKLISRISLFLAILGWLTQTVATLFLVWAESNSFSLPFASNTPSVIFVVYAFFVFLYYRYRVGRAEQVNFIELLWRVFVTGLITTVVSLLLRLLFFNLTGNRIVEHPLWVNFYYQINIALTTVYLLSTLIVWKRLILYQKTKILIRGWRIFQGLLLGSMLLTFLGIESLDLTYNIALGVLIVLGLVFSVNLKWVAYLNFRQKWQAILLILLSILYVFYFFIILLNSTNNLTIYFDLLDSVFIVGLFAFIFIYAIFSLLVVLFNLPTSSVFEKKLKEVVNFQRLSQTIPSGKDEKEVFDILIESSVAAVFANAAWIQIFDKKRAGNTLLKFEVSDDLVQLHNTYFDNPKSRSFFEKDAGDILNKPLRTNINLKGSPYSSALYVPFTIQGEESGRLVLLKDVTDGFTKEMVDIVTTFVNQTVVSVENFRLLNDAIKNERYKEELKIAQRVQQSLMPDSLDSSDDYSITVHTKAADEVGGDYYDTFEIDKDRIAVIIGDVSGKGTSAAFHMAQMKGVFHSLIQISDDPKDFLVHANHALSRCLEKTSFVTTTIFFLDRQKKQMTFARAGHCPSLFYDNEQNQVRFFRNRGLGLGILRNDSFEKYIEKQSIPYNSGDILLLYTDGIVEAKNSEGEDFGYDRLARILDNHKHQCTEDIKEEIIQQLYDFCGTSRIDDDYTIMILKFE